jgi:uncharacterized protein (TIGR02569 family)
VPRDVDHIALDPTCARQPCSVSGERPPAAVLCAFDFAGTPVPLAGGQGSSWRVGNVVLKPADLSERELEWQAEVLASISCDGFRVPRRRRARNGSVVVAGWCAQEAVAGRYEERRWPDIIAVGERFHAALRGIPRPNFIDRRRDPWAIGDRVAWGDVPATEAGDVKHLPRLTAALRPLEAPSQLVHGDLGGNVLFDESLTPAVIDFSPYWRPAPFALAVVVADALVWEGADEGILDAVAHVEDFDQYLLRALIYRTVTDRLARPHEPHRVDADDPYLPAAELACRLADGR